jgi:hypothetical protein
MKILGVVALTAALVATQAFTPGASAKDNGTETAGTSQREHAVSERADARHQTRPERNAAGRRSSSAFASVPSGAFDGEWSVLITTRSGACDPAYRYGVEIRNGEVLNAGGAPVSLEGHVARNGVVRVTIAAGDQEAHGAGRLSRTSGGGTWQGQGSAGTCAGTWEAERRG